MGSKTSIITDNNKLSHSLILITTLTFTLMKLKIFYSQDANYLSNSPHKLGKLSTKNITYNTFIALKLLLPALPRFFVSNPTYSPFSPIMFSPLLGRFFEPLISLIKAVNKAKMPIFIYYHLLVLTANPPQETI